MAEVATQTNPESLEQLPPKKRSLKTVGTLLLVVGIMAAEGFVGWWAIAHHSSPRPSHGGAGLESPATEAQAAGHGDEKTAEKAPEEGEVEEVSIGEFQLSHQSSEGLAMQVQLELSATVRKELAVEFTAVSEEHHSRMRQIVLSTVRSATAEELSDPALSLLRRRIQDHLNQLLEKPYFVDLIVSNVSILAQ